MMRIATRLAAAGATSVLAMSGMAAATAAPAQSEAKVTGCHVPYCYAAISMSNDATSAYSYNANTRHKAVQMAQQRCKAESNRPGACTRMGSVGNGCIAVAYRWNGSTVTKWGTGFGRSLEAARHKAKAKVGAGARKGAAACTTRRY